MLLLRFVTRTVAPAPDVRQQLDYSEVALEEDRDQSARVILVVSRFYTVSIRIQSNEQAVARSVSQTSVKPLPGSNKRQLLPARASNFNRRS